MLAPTQCASAAQASEERGTKEEQSALHLCQRPAESQGVTNIPRKVIPAAAVLSCFRNNRAARTAPNGLLKADHRTPNRARGSEL